MQIQVNPKTTVLFCFLMMAASHTMSLLVGRAGIKPTNRQTNKQKILQLSSIANVKCNTHGLNIYIIVHKWLTTLTINSPFIKGSYLNV